MPSENIEFAVLLHFPDEAKLIGSIIGTWNTIEFGTHVLLGLLTGMGPEHARTILSAILNSDARLQAIWAAGKVELKNDQELLNEFEAIIAALRARAKVRHRYAHGIYVKNEKNQLCILHKEYEFPPMPKHMDVIYSHVLAEEGLRFIEVNLKVWAFLRTLWEKMSQEKRLALHIRSSQQDLFRLSSAE